MAEDKGVPIEILFGISDNIEILYDFELPEEDKINLENNDNTA